MCVCVCVYTNCTKIENRMTVTRVSRTKRSSDCAVGTLEFEFKEDSRNGRVSDWLRKICFRDGI